MTTETGQHELHRAFEAAVNAGDLEALLGLYAPDARLITLDGSLAEGRDAIREQYELLMAMNGTITMQTRYAFECGEFALLSNRWTLRVGHEQMSAITSEVARRDADCRWRYLIDNPYAADLVTTQGLEAIEHSHASPA
jgi:uncharacterized protein (TIGR02246 family)